MTGPLELEAVGPGQPRLQLAPDPVVGPGGRVLVRVALEVHPLHGVGALADQREAAVRAGVDQLRGARRRLAQDPEPGERVLDEVARPPLPGIAADAAGAVGADDEVGAWTSWALPVGVGEAHRGRSVVRSCTAVSVMP